MIVDCNYPLVKLWRAGVKLQVHRIQSDIGEKNTQFFDLDLSKLWKSMGSNLITKTSQKYISFLDSLIYAKTCDNGQVSRSIYVSMRSRNTAPFDTLQLRRAIRKLDRPANQTPND